MRGELVDRIHPFLSEATKSFHRKGGKFEGPPIEVQVYWTSVVLLALSLLGSVGGGSLLCCATIPQMQLCLRMRVGDIQEDALSEIPWTTHV